MIGQMPTLANPPLQEGTQLENYRVLRLLAKGGFSLVYLAHDDSLFELADGIGRIGS